MAAKTSRSNASAPRQSDLQKIVDDWNEKHPVGTLVTVANSVGDVTQAETSAPAMLLAKSTPVVWLKGVRDYIQLARVQVI